MFLRRARKPATGERTRLMGETRAAITVRRQPGARKRVRVRCVVDTGADMTVLPRRLLDSLGVRPHRREPFELADGSLIERDIGRVFVQFKDRAEFTPVLFGEEGDATLLGVLTLEVLGLAVDPLRREIYPVELKM